MSAARITVAAAAATLLAATAPVAAQLAASPIDASPQGALDEPALGDVAWLQAQAEPGEDEVGTIAVDELVPRFYARGGVFLLFPQDVAFEGITFDQIQNPDPNQGGLLEIPADQDLTLGFGGGLYAAAGYNFRPNERVNPRIEAEYQLLIADYRDADDDGITWNSVGGNALVDFRVHDNVALYGGAGAGLVYVSFANPPLELNRPPGVFVPGSDDHITLYVQALGGALFHFSDDIDIDVGMRYQYAQADAFAGDVEFNNVVFHVGLLLHLE